MKKYNILIFMILFFTLSNTLNTYGSTGSGLEQILIEAGVEDEYVGNIINYVNSNSIPKHQLIATINLTRATIESINGRSKITEFSLGELYHIYNNISTICSNLNIKITISFINLNLQIIDNETGNVILKGDVRKLNEYAIMYEALMSNKDFIDELIN